MEKKFTQKGGIYTEIYCQFGKKLGMAVLLEIFCQK